MNTIHPNKDQEDDSINSHELTQGEEISLGIEPRSIKPEVTDEDKQEVQQKHPEYQKITKIHHKNQDESAKTAPHAEDDFKVSQIKPASEHKPSLEIEIQQYPKIDLIPDSVQSDVVEKEKRTVRQKISEIRKHKHWHNAKLIIATVLVFLLLFNSQWFISQFIYLFNKPKVSTTTQTQTAVVETKKNEAEVVGPQNEIIIPKIGVTAPLVFINTTNEPDVLVALRDGVVHYYGTAMPGENGNAAFFGHSSNDWWEPGSYKFVFVLLEKLAVGDTYEIHYNSRKYVYQVTQTKVVAPNDLSVLNQTAEPTSTLITCTPPGTSWQRFVVSAKQIAPAPTAQTQNQVVQSSNTQADQGKQNLPGAAPSIWQQITTFFGGLFGGNKNTEKQNTNPVQSSQQHLPEVN